ncbi:D-(-)-3-hydroxybutyrate oligomer hydrolase [Pseudomarimonas salicorniae]|uniref:D-(-)-3-hydroxybutyrate oligomer hydrolase n=1 Tax=Pseudomarimonas salicorniae TaxID=2933270 RepID=A0ABT0GI18_9GAMM|nr:D-(-)-3-hydroxybutyrate oligomer hydrolase [Lysobacter sp. CAU 1642]MCK7594188.1 D-(-)-3-hydroxybutyrate oligomer hydrolase [Lysobacter sp. CAU 1642]
MEWIDFEGQRVAVALHEQPAADDLLSGGLGLAGLQVPIEPPAGPLDRAARRRRALHANWQGIAFLAAPDPGLVEALSQPIPGQELHAYLRPPDAPGHRVMLQVPEHFDPANPRLLVTASSGSRGVYGAVALASAWALPRGWAVVHTDKGCGTDWFDAASGCGPDLLGEMTDDPSRQLFRPSLDDVAPDSVLIAHAHSGGNPEAHWGEYVRQAMRFGWAALDALHPGNTPSRSQRRRCVALGLSNGGAAVLRAIEQPEGFDGAVVLAPNVLARHGGRGFLDYAAEAALWLPLALQVRELEERVAEVRPFAPVPLEQYAEASRAALHALGWTGVTPHGAWRHLRRRGWPEAALGSALLSTMFDFWYAAGHTYTAALASAAPSDTPMRSHYAALDAAGQPRPSSEAERELWWSDGSGIVPGAGVGIVDPAPRAEQLVRLHRMLHGSGRDQRIMRGMAATRCAAPGGPLPVQLIHGQRDGLIPPAFSSLPYARMARRAGARLAASYPANAPHFDAYLALPGYNRGLSPLLPHAGEALDALLSQL